MALSNQEQVREIRQDQNQKLESRYIDIQGISLVLLLNNTLGFFFIPTHYWQGFLFFSIQIDHCIFRVRLGKTESEPERKIRHYFYLLSLFFLNKCSFVYKKKTELKMTPIAFNRKCSRIYSYHSFLPSIGNVTKKNR